MNEKQVQSRGVSWFLRRPLSLLVGAAVAEKLFPPLETDRMSPSLKRGFLEGRGGRLFSSTESTFSFLCTFVDSS